jgi:hypothetical protein
MLMARMVPAAKTIHQIASVFLRMTASKQALNLSCAIKIRANHAQVQREFCIAVITDRYVKGAQGNRS